MARKTSPAKQRMMLAAQRRSAIGSALQQIQLDCATPESKVAFLEWRNHPLTLLMLDCVRELELTPPAGYIDTEDISTQYGVSSGLALAHSFMSDPTVMFPQLFSGATPGAPQDLPPADYSVDPFSAAAGHGKK